MSVLLSFTQLLETVGDLEVAVIDGNVPAMSSILPVETKFEKKVVDEEFATTVWERPSLEIKDSRVWMFGKKCERLGMDQWMFDEILSCCQGYRIYMTYFVEVVENRERSVSEIPIRPTKPREKTMTFPTEKNVGREFSVKQCVFEPNKKPKGELVVLHVKYRKLGTHEWRWGNYLYKFV